MPQPQSQAPTPLIRIFPAEDYEFSEDVVQLVVARHGEDRRCTCGIKDFASGLLALSLFFAAFSFAAGFGTL